MFLGLLDLEFTDAAFGLFWTHVNPYGRFELNMNAHLNLAAAAVAPLPGPRSGEPATV